MKTTSTLLNLTTSLTQNITAANQALMFQLLNDQHRYLIQRYFDNERSVTTTTVGSMNLTLTGAPAVNATTATLTVAWAYPTGSQLVNFSDQEQRTVLFTNGSTAISWTGGLTGSTVTTAISTLGFQAYNIPANVSKIKNDTINVGQLKFVPAPIMTRAEWDLVNFLPYNSDIPNYYFIYNGQLLLWPIPSTTGNIITFNYKARVPDFSTAFLFSDTAGTAYVAGAATFDYQVGSLSGITAGSTTITGSSTSWNTTGKYPLNTDVTPYNLYLSINAPQGEGIWYPISKFNSDTSLTLALPIINAPSATSASHGYSIGQMPVLSEDFADMLSYGVLATYFSTLVEKPEKFKQFDLLYKERLIMLEDYAGTKSVNVDLGAQPQFSNPNLYPYAQ